VSPHPGDFSGKRERRIIGMFNMVKWADELRKQCKASSYPYLANMSEEEEERLYQASLARFLRQHGQV